MSEPFGKEFGTSVVEAFEIEVFPNKRCCGIGTKVMKELCEWADKHNIVLSLTPDNYQGTSVVFLRKWYRTFGFKPNKGRNKDFRTQQAFVRKPERKGE